MWALVKRKETDSRSDGQEEKLDREMKGKLDKESWMKPQTNH